ncbi:hypothetical protein SprV_0802547300 [Sparganum proliferum]
MAGKAVKRLTGNGTGQSFVDRVTSMKHSLSGSLIAKTICKATTEEMIAPKRKHLCILINCTYEPRLSMPDFANYLIARSHNSSWVVSFKALITIHHLMNSGSESFSQYLASNNCQLSSPRNFDGSNMQANTMFSFIRHYATYLDSRSSSYREVAFDLCKIKRKRDETNLRTMPLTKLFKVLPPLERQIDALLTFDASSNELMNSVIQAAYFLLYKDLIRLYAVYNEAMINIIGNYFSMPKKECQESLRIYKSFIKRMDQVNSFVKVAEACGPLNLQDDHNSQSLIFKPVPPTVLEALEQHLVYLESRKIPDRTPPTTTGAASGTVSPQPSNASLDLFNPNGQVPAQFRLHFTNEQQQRIIEEERERLEAYVQHAKDRPMSAAAMAIGGLREGDRANSDGDLIEVFASFDSSPPPVNFAAAAATTTTSSAFSSDAFNSGGLLDDFWLPPQNPVSSSGPTKSVWAQSGQLPSSASHFAIASASSAQPRPLSQFLSHQPLSLSAATPQRLSPSPAASSTNPFLLPQPAVSNAWVTTGANHQTNAFDLALVSSTPSSPPLQDLASAQAPTNGNGPSSSASDLDNRLAELAGSLTIGGWNSGGTPITSVNWSTGRRPLTVQAPTNASGVRPSPQPQLLSSAPLAPVPAPTNPWPSTSMVPSQPYAAMRPQASVFAAAPPIFGGAAAAAAAAPSQFPLTGAATSVSSNPLNPFL